MTSLLADHGSQSIFIAPTEPLAYNNEIFEPHEIRFMRRLVRDYRFRNTEAEFTFALWRSVRENEEKNIYPYVSQSDHKINSSMPYEIGVLKPFLYDVLGHIDEKSQYYSEARRILERIRCVEEIPAELIPDHALYKEFV